MNAIENQHQTPTRTIRWLKNLTGVTLAFICGVMAINNPSQGDYEKYATDYLATYLKESKCTQISGELKVVWRSGCKTLVDTGRSYLQPLIEQTTTRSNFVLFSIYQTDLAFESSIPSYHFETIAIMHKFYIFEE